MITEPDLTPEQIPAPDLASGPHPAAAADRAPDLVWTTAAEPAPALDAVLTPPTTTVLRRQRRRRPHPLRRIALAAVMGVGLAGIGAPAYAATAATAATDSATFDTGDVHTAIADAEAVLTHADVITTQAALSGLDLGEGEATVDSAELRQAVADLSHIELVPQLSLAERTEDMVAQTADVADATAQLAEQLDRARAVEAARLAAEEAAREAAEKAQREAEAKAKAAAEAKAKAAAQAAAAASADNSAAGAQATAQALASSDYGWGADQFSCLVSLWNRESGWNYQAYNASSGATGIPQALPGSKMASAGSDWQTNATTQIIWGLRYIASAYGTPCGAWSHSQATGWY